MKNKKEKRVRSFGTK